jgi:ribonuclease HI
METAVVARGLTYYRADYGQGGNNDAEWLALIHAMEVALSVGARDVVMMGDSALVVLQANGTNKCRHPGLRIYRDTFLKLKTEFTSITVRQIGRSQNLAGIALTKMRWQINPAL